MTLNKLAFTSVALVAIVASATALILAADKNPAAPGTSQTPKTKLLEAGAEMLQGEAPLKAIHAHVCGFHFYNGEPSRQVIAHHYCAHLSEDVMQCAIYDTDKKNARLIGIEYIISAKIFATLSDEEKTLWHSHVYEVKSGALTGPGLPEVAEKELMKSLVNTYGKTWHTWQVDRGDSLPLGIPQLMMGFTADGQINPGILADRDKGYGVSAEAKKKNRADITSPPIDSGANAWEKGQAIQLQAVPVKDQRQPAPR